MGASFDHDHIVIGSGFGGSVSGLRLVEKGYDVLMLEKGREFAPEDFPRTNWDLRKWLWMPRLGLRGLFKMTFFRHVTVLSGVGVGGGSLVYANTLPIPKPSFFESPAWRHLADWETELRPHYVTARRMLGATQTPFLTRPDEILREIAKDRGTPEAFQPTHVGVHFGDPGETVPDPYFGGDGPDRTGCIRCGACMTGCRHDAKNTLDKNYLHLARARGLTLLADTEVTSVTPLEGGGYRVEALEGRGRFSRRRRSWTARSVVFAAGVLGTVELLLRMKADGALPRLSDRLGERIRTNSESLIGVTTQDRSTDLSQGIAIGSILELDDESHGEVVRYGGGSGIFRLLGAAHVHGRVPRLVRLLDAAWTYLRRPWRMLRTHLVADWARQTIIVLYMRTAEGTLRFRLRRRLSSLLRRRLSSALATGRPPRANIPEASELAEQVARRVDGQATSLIPETVLGIPTTAHILGGCCMGDSTESGVIDHAHRVFGYEGLYVVDGSAISANPGVNPSLTITALAERAMTLVPERSTAGVAPGEAARPGGASVAAP